MYRCPTCVSILTDVAVKRCPVCGENLKRHPPRVIGAGKRLKDTLTTWDIRAGLDASRMYAQEERLVPEPDIDLPREHLRDSSGRTAATDQR